MTPQFCTFHIGELFLGIEVERIQEVLRDVAITPVPKAPAAIHGLINLRGQIVTAVSLRTVFGLPLDESGGSATMLVLEHRNGLVSLVVDRVGEVVSVRADDFEDPPDALKGGARKLIRGAYKLQQKLLLVLDVEHALKHETNGSGRPVNGLESPGAGNR
jgi:purine-binding chemotaxis protein CheW